MKKKPSPGATVRLTGDFLRNTGQYTGSAPRDKWIVQACDCGLCRRGQFIATNERNLDDDGQRHLNIGNVELVKAPSTSKSQTTHHSTMSTRGESHASAHRQAVRENDRTALARELAKIWDATHAAIYHSKIYAYGTAAEARDFAKGLRDVKVRPITVSEQHALALQKRQAFGNP